MVASGIGIFAGLAGALPFTALVRTGPEPSDCAPTEPFATGFGFGLAGFAATTTGSGVGVCWTVAWGWPLCFVVFCGGAEPDTLVLREGCALVAGAARGWGSGVALTATMACP